MRRRGACPRLEFASVTVTRPSLELASVTVARPAPPLPCYALAARTKGGEIRDTPASGALSTACPEKLRLCDGCAAAARPSLEFASVTVARPAHPLPCHALAARTKGGEIRDTPCRAPPGPAFPEKLRLL